MPYILAEINAGDGELVAVAFGGLVGVCLALGFAVVAAVGLIRGFMEGDDDSGSDG